MKWRVRRLLKNVEIQFVLTRCTRHGSVKALAQWLKLANHIQRGEMLKEDTEEDPSQIGKTHLVERGEGLGKVTDGGSIWSNIKATATPKMQHSLCRQLWMMPHLKDEIWNQNRRVCGGRPHVLTRSRRRWRSEQNRDSTKSHSEKAFNDSSGKSQESLEATAQPTHKP